MNELSDLLQRVVDLLRQTQIPHMIAGSFASTYYGAVRMTQDIDIIIAPTLTNLLELIRHLPEESYYVDEAAVRDAFARRSMFNVMDMQTGWKIDFILRKPRPFSVTEFERRQPARLFNVETFVASPEDVILAKLEWAAMSGSERQLTDVMGMVAAKRVDLDMEYLQTWARELNVVELWKKCKND